MRFLISTLILFALTVCHGQEKPDRQQFDIDATNLQTLNLHNIHGDVEVKGTDTKNILVTIKRQLAVKGQTRLEDARSQVYFDTLLRGSDIYMVMQSPYYEFKIDQDGFGNYNNNKQYTWEERESVNYRFDIEVEIPSDMNLKVSNHYDDLSIENVDGALYAKNHHQDLYANGLGGNARLISHHGNIEGSFTKSPNEECYFETHHGDIKITYPDQLSTDVKFKSHHGDFYTDFPWESKPLQITKHPSTKGTKYKVGDGTYGVINNGGPLQQFSTWHGDIYLVRN